MEIKIHNPQEGVKWNEHLNYLKQEMPGPLKILLKTESLINYLDSFVAHVVAYRAKIEKEKNLTRQQAEIFIMNKLLPDEVKRIEDDFTEKDEIKLKKLLESLEPRIVTLEV